MASLRNKAVLAGLAVLAAGAAAWAVLPLGTTGVGTGTEDGRALYARHCASCHGAALEGQPNWRERRPDGRLPAPPHDPGGHTWHHPDPILFAMIREGVAAMAPPGYISDMPGFKEVLSDREIAAVLAYIKSTWPADIQARQAAVTAEYRRSAR